jgi:hypothetical protein
MARQWEISTSCIVLPVYGPNDQSELKTNLAVPFAERTDITRLMYIGN